METPDPFNDLDRLVEVEARIDLYRSRRRGVVMRMVFLFLPLSVVTFLIMDLRFSLPMIVAFAALSLADHLIHFARFRSALRERAQMLAQRNG